MVTGGSHKWLCGGPGCGWIYVEPSLHRNTASGRDRLDGACSGRSRSKPRRSTTPNRCTASATARRRFPDTSSAKPGHDMIRNVGVATHSRAQRAAHARRSSTMAQERGLRDQHAARSAAAHRMDRHRFRRLRTRLPRTHRSAAYSSITGRVAAFASARTSTRPTKRSTRSFDGQLDLCGDRSR